MEEERDHTVTRGGVKGMTSFNLEKREPRCEGIAV